MRKIEINEPNTSLLFTFCNFDDNLGLKSLGLKKILTDFSVKLPDLSLYILDSIDNYSPLKSAIAPESAPSFGFDLVLIGLNDI